MSSIGSGPCGDALSLATAPGLAAFQWLLDFVSGEINHDVPGCNVGTRICSTLTPFGPSSVSLTRSQPGA